MPSRSPEPLSPELILVAPPEEAELARKRLAAAPWKETELPRKRVGAPNAEERLPLTGEEIVEPSAASSFARELVAAPRFPDAGVDAPPPRIARGPVGPDSERALPREPAVASSDEAELGARPAATSGAPEWQEFLASVRSSATTAAEVERTRPRPPQSRRRSRKPIVLAIVILAIAGSIGLAWARARSEQRVSSLRPSTPAAAQPVPRPVKPTRHANGSERAPATAGKHSKSARQSKPTAPPGAFVPSRIWSWAKVPGSAHYLVRFFRSGHRILAVRTTRPELILPKTFVFHPGRYRWMVVSISAKDKGRRAIVDSTFVVASH